MNRIRKICIEASVDLVEILFNARTIVLLILLAFILLAYLNPLAQAAHDTMEVLCIYEPITSILNAGTAFPSPFFYIYAFFLILICDQPQVNGSFRYRISRIGRSTWGCGQIMCMLVLCVLYIAYVNLICLIPFRFDFDGNTWSRVIRSLLYTNLGDQKGIQISISSEIISVYTPGQAAALSNILLFLYALTSAFIVLILHSKFSRLRPFGVSALLLFYMFEYIRELALPYITAKYSPVALARLTSINNGYTMYAPTLRYALSVWFILIAICLVLMITCVQRLYIEEA